MKTTIMLTSTEFNLLKTNSKKFFAIRNAKDKLKKIAERKLENPTSEVRKAIGTLPIKAFDNAIREYFDGYHKTFVEEYDRPLKGDTVSAHWRMYIN